MRRTSGLIYFSFLVSLTIIPFLPAGVIDGFIEVENLATFHHRQAGSQGVHGACLEDSILLGLFLTRLNVRRPFPCTREVPRWTVTVTSPTPDLGDSWGGPIIDIASQGMEPCALLQGFGEQPLAEVFVE